MSTSSQLPKLEQARKLLDQGDVAQAVKLVDDVLRRDPKDTEARFLLGVTHFKKGEWATAERIFRDAIALSNRHTLAHYYLGLTLERQHRPEDARLEYQFALTTQPDFQPAKEKLGMGDASKSHIDDSERPVIGDREEARVYKGELLFSGKRRMRSFSRLFALQLTALIAMVFQPLCALVFLLLWAILWFFPTFGDS